MSQVRIQSSLWGAGQPCRRAGGRGGGGEGTELLWEPCDEQRLWLPREAVTLSPLRPLCGRRGSGPAVAHTVRRHDGEGNENRLLGVSLQGSVQMRGDRPGWRCCSCID